MVGHTERGATQLSDDNPTYGVLLDELADVIRRGKEADVEAFIAEHPSHEDELRRMLPTVRAIVMLGDSQEELDDDHARLGRNKTLGDFRIIRQIGRGGMGVVYEAEQVSLPRRVALKVLPYAGMLDPRQLERFKNESRAAATLDHPGIVSVYSVGCVRAIHFYALQYVEGQSLAEVISQLRGEREATTEASRMTQLTKDFVSGSINGEAVEKTVDQAADSTMRSATAGSTSSTPLGAVGTIESRAFLQSVARLGIQVAEALDHAHTRGIVHRDIKPGNLLLDTEGKVKVADFGLARFEADAGVTMTGDIVGTLRYMSPEQALAKRVVVDHRTDIYSLGVTLYELLTLEPPFRGNDRHALLRQIAFDEPTAPRKLNRAIPRELEIIVQKAIAKNPNDRYATAENLAEDLTRFLGNKPIKARRVSRMEHTWRWAKRNPVVSSLALLTTLLAVLVAVVATVGYAQATLALTEAEQAKAQVLNERDAVKAERDIGYRNLYVAHIQLAQQAWAEGGVGRLLNILDEHIPKPNRRDHRGWEWYYLRSLPQNGELTFHDAGRPILSVDWSPDGQRIASLSKGPATIRNGKVIWNQSEVKIWNADTGKVIKVLVPPRKQYLCDVVWSPDGTKIAGISSFEVIWIWDLATENRVVEIDTGAKRGVRNVSWSADGNEIAGCHGRSVVIWDAKTGRQLRALEGHGTVVRRVAWSADGNWIAVRGDEPGHVTIFDAVAGQIHRTIPARSFAVISSVDWSPDSKRLVAATSYVPTATIWDIQSGETLLTIRHPQAISNVTWSPDGQYFAAATGANVVTIWNATSGEAKLELIGHFAGICGITWSPNGERIATCSHDGTVKIWSTDATNRQLVSNKDVVAGVTWSPDDRYLASATSNNDVTICDATSGDEIRRLEGYYGLSLEHLSWNSNGQYLASPGDDGSIRVWNTATGKVVRTWRHEDVQKPVSKDLYRSVDIDWHPTLDWIVSVSGNDEFVRVWDVDAGTELFSYKTNFRHPYGYTNHECVRWSPDGERLAIKTSEGAIQIRNIADWRVLHSIGPSYVGGTGALAWSPNGRYLADVGGGTKPLKTIDTLTGRGVIATTGQTYNVSSVEWSADGRRILTAGNDKCRIWDAETGMQLLELEGRHSAAWSHNRKRIAVNVDGGIRVYDAAKGYALEDDPLYRSNRAFAHTKAGSELMRANDFESAIQEFLFATELDPESTDVLVKAVWHIAACPDQRLHDTAGAVQLADEAVAMQPNSAMAWQVLGWARYRDGQWRTSIDALNRSIELQGDGGNVYQWLWLAMAHWQLDEKEEARSLYSKAIEHWNEDWLAGEAEPEWFRREAAELMGMK